MHAQTRSAEHSSENGRCGVRACMPCTLTLCCTVHRSRLVVCPSGEPSVRGLATPGGAVCCPLAFRRAMRGPQGPHAPSRSHDDERAKVGAAGVGSQAAHHQRPRDRRRPSTSLHAASPHTLPVFPPGVCCPVAAIPKRASPASQRQLATEACNRARNICTHGTGDLVASRHR